MKAEKTVFLTAFFKFDKRGPEYGFERIQLEHINSTLQLAKDHMSFCDEAGWFEGALIEERELDDHQLNCPRNRIWLIQQSDGEMKEIEEPKVWHDCLGLIG